jgi:hypothetical protein
MKAVCLVVVRGGVADEYSPKHVNCAIVDQDNIAAGEPPYELPRDVGFEKLVKDACLIEGKDFVWE